MRLEKWIHFDLIIVSEKYFKNGLQMHFNDSDIIDVAYKDGDPKNDLIVYLH